MHRNDIQAKIVAIIADLGVPAEKINADTPLIGPQALVKSRELVEILLAVEEFAEDELNIKFDWTSDAAMSEKRSVFRTIGILTDHLTDLLQQKAA